MAGTPPIVGRGIPENPPKPKRYLINVKLYGLFSCPPENFVKELDDLCQKFTESEDEYSYSWTH